MSEKSSDPQSCVQQVRPDTPVVALAVAIVAQFNREPIADFFTSLIDKR